MVDQTRSSADCKDQLPRVLGRASLLGFACNAVVGAGIIGVSGQAAASLGNSAIFALALATLAAGLIAACFCTLASRFDGPGGPYQYVERTYGPQTAFYVGWLYYAARPLAAAATLTLAADFVQPPGGVLGRALFVCLTGGLFTSIALAGLRASAAINNLTTILKFALLIGLVIWLAMRTPSEQSLPSPASETLSFAQVLILYIYCYAGFESVSVLAGDARAPRTDLPWALGTGMIIAGALYLLITIFGPVNRSSIPPSFSAAISIVLLAGTLSQFVAPPRMLFALASAAHLPAALRTLHGRSATPRAAILTSAVIIVVSACVLEFTRLAIASVGLRLVVYVACCMSLTRSTTDASDARSSTLPVQLLALAATSISFALLIMIDLGATVVLGSVFFSGVLVKLVMRT